MLHPFRVQYPQGSILSEFLKVEHGLFVVRVQVQVNGVILGTGLAAERTIEEAEDIARIRALETVLTASSGGEYAVLDNPIASASPQIAAEAPPVQTTELTPESLLAKPNYLEIAPQDVPQSQKTVATAEPLLSSLAIPENNVVETPAEISPPKSKKTTPSLPTQLPVESPIQSLPVQSPVESLVKAKVTEPTESLPLPLAEIAEIEQAIAPPSVVDYASETVDYASEVEPASVTAIPPRSEPVVPAVAPPNLTVPSSDPIDFSEVIAKSNMELKRLGWSSDQGRNYLLQTYGKRSRQLLSDEELLEFLLYLESLPTPVRA